MKTGLSLIKNRHLDRIGLASDGGFPHQAYCFTDGLMSVQMEKNGGLNELHCLEMREKDGRRIIETEKTPILSKRYVKDYSYGMYGPVLRFVSITRGGRNLYHVPDRVRFLPFGFTSASDRFGVHTEYHLCMKDKMVQFSFRNSAKDRDALQMMFCPPGLAKGDFGSCLSPDEFVDANVLSYEATPVRYKRMQWKEPQLDARSACWHVQGRMDRMTTNQVEPELGRATDLCLAMAFGKKPAIVRNEFDYQVIAMPWDGDDELRILLVLESTLEQCQEAIAGWRADPDRMWRDQIVRYTALADSTPKVQIKQHETANDMARTIPLFLNAMRLYETDEQTTIRAATHKFGYFPGWDVEWPLDSFLLWGQYDFVKKALVHSLSCVPWLVPEAKLLIPAVVAEYYALTRDRDFMESCYHQMRTWYLEALAQCHPKTGFPIGGQLAADNPKQLKQPHRHCFNPDRTGLYYSTIRAMENLAMILGDEEGVRINRTQADRIRRHFLPVFYNPRVGYFYSAVEPKTGEKVDVYHTTGTAAMNSPYGDILFDPVMENLAAFQRDHLYHPSGKAAVPFWCKADEMWKSCIMLQHANHEMQTMRFARESGELMRMWRLYEDLFAECKLQIETINLCGMQGDSVGQRADWQAFGTSAQYGVLIRSIAGLNLDYRGLTYLPCNLPVPVSIKGLSHGTTCWDVTVTGEGDWVESFEVDGKPVRGAFKAPSACFEQGRHKLTIRRGSRPPAGPCLLRAIGAGVTVLKSDRRRLIVDLDGTGRIPVRFFAPARPSACRVNGRKQAFEWNATKHTGLAEVIVHGQSRVEIIQ